MVEETRAIESTVHYEVVADMGSGLLIAKVKLADIREQDINARIMKTEMQKQLTDNIKKRGQLESLPFCALIDNRIEIISGHHRIRLQHEDTAAIGGRHLSQRGVADIALATHQFKRAAVIG